MAHRSKHVRANHVSFWLEEEGCGVDFSHSQEEDDAEYLVIQRHFEEPDDGRACILTDDEATCGFFRRVLGTLTRDQLDIRYGSNTVVVSFVLSEEDFLGVAKVLKVLAPSIQIAGDESPIPHDGG